MTAVFPKNTPMLASLHRDARHAVRRRRATPALTATVVATLAGLTTEQVVGELPGLEPADVTACLRFASRRLDHPVLAA